MKNSIFTIMLLKVQLIRCKTKKRALFSVIFYFTVIISIISCNRDEVNQVNNITDKSKYVVIKGISLNRITVYNGAILADILREKFYIGDSLAIFVHLYSFAGFTADYFFWDIDSLSGTPIIARVSTDRGDVENFILQAGIIDGYVYMEIPPLLTYLPYIATENFRKGNGFLEISPEGENITVSVTYNGSKITKIKTINKRGDT